LGWECDLHNSHRQQWATWSLAGALNAIPDSSDHALTESVMLCYKISDVAWNLELTKNTLKNTSTLKKNKEERYSRVPRLSDTRYSAIWRYASSKARLKCATYRRYTDLSVTGSDGH